MEQDKSFKFKLYVPPRLNNTQVSAVKPQTNTGDGIFFQDFNKETEDDYNLPFVMKSTPKRKEVIEPISQKVIPMMGIHQENEETVKDLYSRLYKEAEKIKRWKVTVEYELKEKERILQENRKITEALRKAIQELQFENEKLSLKLEDEIHANKDILKENNATRHLCSLLKEKYVQLMEKSNKYEQEREETRQMYVDFNSNIERMILAFEELRAQAENSRLEMYYKLKEEAENTAQLEKDYKSEINTMDKEVTVLIAQNNDKDNKIKEINIQLHESRELISELEEIRNQQGEMLKKAQMEQQNLFIEKEEMKSSLQKTESACKNLETELQTAVKTLIQVTEQKELIIEELKETRVLHASATDEFQTTILNLKMLLEKEEKRQKELREETETLILKLRKKTTELEFIVKLRNDNEKQLEEMTVTLEHAAKIQRDLEHQLENERSEKILLVKEKETRHLDDSAIQVHIKDLLAKKQLLEETIEKLREREKEQKDTLHIREEEILDLEMKLSGAFENEQNCLQQLSALKTELEKEKLINEQLRMDWNKVLMDKEHIATEKSNILSELKNNRMMGEKAEKHIEVLKETNIQLRNELESLKENLKKKDEESKSKLDESRENVRNIENDISKKEKQLKTLENKVNNLKKQIETKTKNAEELQQENKVLRKKVAAESKQSSIAEAKVNKLELELENMNVLYKETVDRYNDEIELAKATEEKLLKEVEKMKTAAAEAITMQKEIDLQCQHKITEMLALMEKHKHQYDKTVEEKDTELEYYKKKEQNLSSAIGSLENELSCKKNEICCLQKQLKTEIEEKEILAREAKKADFSKKEKKEKETQTSIVETPKTSSLDSRSINPKKNISQHFTPINANKLEYKEKISWTPAKTYTVKTPPKSKLPKETTDLHSEDATKKRKILLELDVPSESSENNDLLSIMSDEEVFKTLSKDRPPASPLKLLITPKKVQTPFTLKTPASSVKLSAIRRMRESGWTAVSKIDRKKKMKEAGKLFT